MPRPVLLPAAVLGVTFVLAKAALAWRKMRYLEEGGGASLLVAITAEDVAVAMASGLIAALILRLTARRPRLHRAAGAALLVAGALAAVYAVANVAICRTLGFPLNARTLALAGRFAGLRSSVAEACTPAILAGMASALVAFVLAVRWRAWLAPSRGAALALVVVAVAWVGCGWILRASADPGAWAHRGGRNPHREIVGSLAARLLLDQRVELVGPFPGAYLDDFKPAVERRLPPLANGSPPPRNVILVVLESAAAQYTSLHGGQYDTTPRLLAEARHGAVFDRFYAHVGYTYAARMPLMHSIYPGLPWNFSPADTRPMPPGLAALLKARGYRTAFVSAADPEHDGLNYVARDAGMDDILGPTELGGRMASSWGTEDGVVVDGLTKWIDADRSKPFFALLWTDQTHHPYTLSADTTPVDFLEGADAPHAAALNRYLNAMRQADRHLGRLFDFLRARGIADDTLVVVTGDHGEAFGDPHDDVIGHGGGVYEENLRVPLLIWNPRLFPGGQRHQRAGAQVDINPTIAHLLGVAPPPDWQGASLFSPDHPGRAYLLADRGGFQFAVTDARYKYVLHETDGFERLYDLQADSRERTDVAANLPHVAQEMRRRISAFVRAEEQYLNPSR